MGSKRRTVNERLEELEVQVAKINRALWGENGHKGLIQRQEEDDDRFKEVINDLRELHGYYYKAYSYIKIIVNILRWTTRILIATISLLSITKWKEIWRWFVETFSK